MQGKHLILTIGDSAVYPGNSIIRKVIQTLLVEIYDGAAHRCHCEYKQQRAGELGLKIPQAAVSLTTLKTIKKAPGHTSRCNFSAL
jgi:hypothetical protein